MPGSQPELRDLAPTAIDIFSGCGGLSLGLKLAGFRIISAVEIDQLAAETYAANHPTVPLNICDVRSLDPTVLVKASGIAPGQLDLLAGCPPCQGFSNLRTKNRGARLIDPRNRLIDEMLRFTEFLLPKVVMVENVPHLARYSRFLNFKKRLRLLGYNILVQVVDVADFGIPQRRKRLVLLGSRIGEPPRIKACYPRRSVRQAFAALRNVDADPLHDLKERRTKRIANLIKKVPKDGGSRSALPKRLQLTCHTKNDGFYDVYGRMSWDEVAPTITCGCINPSKGRFLHPEEDRAITLREAAILQGFPVDYQFSMRKGKYAAAELIGNALPPEFSRIQAEAILAHVASRLELET